MCGVMLIATQLAAEVMTKVLHDRGIDGFDKLPAGDRTIITKQVVWIAKLIHDAVHKLHEDDFEHGFEHEDDRN